MSTYRNEMIKELQNFWIYSPIDKWWAYFFKKWYYVSREVIRKLKYWDKIINFANMPQWFADLFWITRATVRNKTIKKEYIFLKEWYYNIDGLIKYLL